MVNQALKERYTSHEAAKKHIIRLYWLGANTREICVQLGNQVSAFGVLSMLREEGVRLRPRGGSNNRVPVKISQQDYFKYTYKELMERTGLSSSAVYQRIKHYPPKAKRYCRSCALWHKKLLHCSASLMDSEPVLGTKEACLKYRQKRR